MALSPSYFPDNATYDRAALAVAQALVASKQWRLLLTEADGQLLQWIVRDEKQFHRFWVDPESTVRELAAPSSEYGMLS